MYGENRFNDPQRFLRAVFTNQIARITPRLYIKLTGQTGRGAEKETAEQIADYFKMCFYDYFRVLGIRPWQIGDYLEGKRILEYGPGDVLAVGLLMLAYGARSVVCVDRFPIYSMSVKNVEVLQLIIDSLEGQMQLRAKACFRRSGDIASGFTDQRLRYLVRPSGLSGLTDAADLIISRAVLEQVNSLPATFADMRHALCHNGVAVHKVDLQSHGLHHRNPLDFLTWPPHLWAWMYAHKGYVNRWRIDRYHEVLAENCLKIVIMRPTMVADRRDIEEVRPYLASPFRNVSDEDLRWLGFWLVCRRVDDCAV